MVTNYVDMDVVMLFSELENRIQIGLDSMKCGKMVELLVGEMVYCHGIYGHDLRKEVYCGKENRHYRLKHNLSCNC